MKLQSILLVLMLVMIVCCEGMRKNERQRKRLRNQGGQKRPLRGQRQHQLDEPLRHRQGPQRGRQARQGRNNNNSKKQPQGDIPRKAQRESSKQLSESPRQSSKETPRKSPARALGANLPDLKKLPNTKFNCDKSQR